MKHSANRAAIDGKRIVLIDDSLVRGTTSMKIVRMMRDAGATRGAFPHRLAADHCIPTITASTLPERDELLAATHSLEEMRDIIGADSLAFLSIDGIYRAMGEPAAIPPIRNSPTIASPATIRRRLTDQTRRARSRGNCRCWRKRADGAHTANSPVAFSVMAGLVPAIHVCKTSLAKTWMPGTSPGMTKVSIDMTQPLADRIALVTGASRGIGYATALALAKAGAHIVAIARTHGGLEELDDEIRSDGGSATLVPLDLKDFDGIARLGAALHERYGKLDILVGNAGIARPARRRSAISSRRPWNDVMAVNVTANCQLIRCMEPLLQASDAGRAVFVTSGAASKATAYLGPYAVSKAALDTLVRIYAERDRDARSCASTCSIPARSAPACAPRVLPGEDPMTLDTPEQVAEMIVPICACPASTETGKLYDYKTRALVSFLRPA